MTPWMLQGKEQAQGVSASQPLHGLLSESGAPRPPSMACVPPLASCFPHPAECHQAQPALHSLPPLKHAEPSAPLGAARDLLCPHARQALHSLQPSPSAQGVLEGILTLCLRAFMQQSPLCLGIRGDEWKLWVGVMALLRLT